MIMLIIARSESAKKDIELFMMENLRQRQALYVHLFVFIRLLIWLGLTELLVGILMTTNRYTRITIVHLILSYRS